MMWRTAERHEFRNYYAAVALDQSGKPVNEFDHFTNFLATIRYGKLTQMT
jgi:hypothetical protein